MKRQAKEGAKVLAGGISAVMAIVILGIGLAGAAALYQFVLKKGADVACHVANCPTVPNLNSNSQDVQSQAAQIAHSFTLTTTTP
jgi:hypothetical protein